MGLAPIWRVREASSVEHAASAAEARPGTQGATVVPDLPPERTADAALAPPAMPPLSSPIGGMDWAALEQAIRACSACPLHERRKMAVPGVGDRMADWLFVGEGPGAEEDQRGEPFVGQAGKLLDAMLAAIGLARGRNVYIANAVKCRPPGNRTPEAGEVAACHPYLERQIALIQPRIIVALGRPAAQTLLGGEVKINAARGRLFDRAGIPVVVTYHPAYLLRNPQDKAKAWEDLCFARASLR
jgi:DNA polymerase